MNEPNIVVSIEAAGRKPVKVPLGARLSHALRAVARDRVIPEGEAVALLVREGIVLSGKAEKE